MVRALPAESPHALHEQLEYEGGGTITMQQHRPKAGNAVEIDQRAGGRPNDHRGNLMHTAHMGNIKSFHERQKQRGGGCADDWAGVIPGSKGEPWYPRFLKTFCKMPEGDEANEG